MNTRLSLIIKTMTAISQQSHTEFVTGTLPSTSENEITQPVNTNSVTMQSTTSHNYNRY